MTGRDQPCGGQGIAEPFLALSLLNSNPPRPATASGPNADDQLISGLDRPLGPGKICRHSDFARRRPARRVDKRHRSQSVCVRGISSEPHPTYCGSRFNRPHRRDAKRNSAMHESSMLRMEWFVKNYVPVQEHKLKVLDVGSYNVNGTYRVYFPDTRFDYVGLDMAAGPNVDIVPANPYSWKEIDDNCYDIVISGQVLEHAEFFWVTVSEMTRVLKKDGLLCIIVPNGFGEHRYPVDCWRFFTDGMIALARYVNLQVLHAHTNCAPTKEDTRWLYPNCGDAMLVASKPYSGKANLVNLEEYKCVPADLSAARGGLVPLI